MTMDRSQSGRHRPPSLTNSEAWIMKHHEGNSVLKMFTFSQRPSVTNILALRQQQRFFWDLIHITAVHTAQAVRKTSHARVCLCAHHKSTLRSGTPVLPCVACCALPFVLCLVVASPEDQHPCQHSGNRHDYFCKVVSVCGQACSTDLFTARLTPTVTECRHCSSTARLLPSWSFTSSGVACEMWVATRTHLIAEKSGINLLLGPSR